MHIDFHVKPNSTRRYSSLITHESVASMFLGDHVMLPILTLIVWEVWVFDGHTEKFPGAIFVNRAESQSECKFVNPNTAHLDWRQSISCAISCPWVFTYSYYLPLLFRVRCPSWLFVAERFNMSCNVPVYRSLSSSSYQSQRSSPVTTATASTKHKKSYMKRDEAWTTFCGWETIQKWRTLWLNGAFQNQLDGFPEEGNYVITESMNGAVCDFRVAFHESRIERVKWCNHFANFYFQASKQHTYTAAARMCAKL